jgi:prepilin peptidase CpaA
MLATILLLGLVSVATVTDFARHKIYNWTTYTGMLAALSLNAIGDVLAGRGASPDQLAAWGWIGGLGSLLGLVACGFLVLVCFVVFSNIGGGDVKLVAMLGAFLGPEQGIVAVLWTFILGACLGLIVLIWRIGAWELVRRVFQRILSWLRLYHGTPLSEEERKELQAPLHLAPAALAAVVVVRFSLERLIL